MFDWLRGRRRLSARARRKLLIAQARAEEAIIDTHVDNVFDLYDLLGDEIDLERAIEEYLTLMPMDETMATSVANRVLTQSQEPAADEPSAPRFREVFRDDTRRR